MRMKRQVTGWDKTFGKDTSDKGQNPLKNKETTHLKKCTEDLNRYFIKKNVQMANENMERYLTSYIISKLHIKATTRYHYTTIRIVKIQNTDKTEC